MLEKTVFKKFNDSVKHYQINLYWIWLYKGIEFYAYPIPMHKKEHARRGEIELYCSENEKTLYGKGW